MDFFITTDVLMKMKIVAVPQRTMQLVEILYKQLCNLYNAYLLSNLNCGKDWVFAKFSMSTESRQ
jgi:hypothetical protein